MLIAVFVVLWFLSGYLSALILERFIDLPFNPITYGFLGTIIGLAALASKLRTERGQRLFFHGPGPDEDGDPLLGCLWAFPVQVLFFILLAWIFYLTIHLTIN